jgi:flagellar biosynthetic protein FlhB
MANEERTERATAKKLRDSRVKEGRVPRSRDLAVAAATIASTIVLGRFGVRLYNGLAGRVRSDLAHLGDTPLRAISMADLTTMVLTDGLFIAQFVGPIALATMVVGVMVHGMQGGWVFTTERLTVNWTALSPANNIKRFGITQSGADTLKAIICVTCIAWLTWSTVRGIVLDSLGLAWMTPGASAAIGWERTESLLWRVAIALSVLALGDYGLQRYRFMESMKMTKQEVKDEHIQQEGRPEVKGRIRRIQREFTRRRMLNDVKKATVVVTNPTHFAVALEYRRGGMAAPRVLAKGADHLALAIRERARQHGVPIVENKPLARALYQTAEVGDFIPAELFAAVAELLAQLIRLKQLVL